MRTKRSHLDGVALGLFIATLIFLMLLMFTDLFPSLANERSQYILGFFTIAATVAAAYLAVRGIREQIQENADREERRRLESLRAERALLPAALSEIIRSSRSVIMGLVHGDDQLSHRTSLDVVSPNSQETIKRCIQFTNEITGDRLTQILRVLQVLQARFDPHLFEEALPEGDVSWEHCRHQHVRYIVDWAVLDALCGSVFDFARGASATIPRSVEKPAVYAALVIPGVHVEEYPRLVEVIESLADRGALEMDFSRPRFQ